MSKKAQRKWFALKRVPLYINLKEFKRAPVQTIDADAIRKFVLQSLNRNKDRDVEEFLEKEFQKGIDEGRWFFLFDSFDEIPEVLSSTEADSTISAYASAISSFLSDLNPCCGVVASRNFRGPAQHGFTSFRILPLSEMRRLELIRKANLDPNLETQIVGQIGTASEGIRFMASNPMFLGLLCFHVKEGRAFPTNAHVVLHTYLDDRLRRDADRLKMHFQLTPEAVRRAAELVAYTMAAQPEIGLSASAPQIRAAMAVQQFIVPHDFEDLLKALVYLKLARFEEALTPGGESLFTFSHRRFQEYFATRIVLSEPSRLPVRQLLLDARWRESAVVFCQTQPPEILRPLIAEARSIISERIALLEELETPLGSSPAPFPWPQGIHALLSLLQEGFGSKSQELPEDLRQNVDRLLELASESGFIVDRKWSVEVAGVSPRSVQLALVRSAFASPSECLRDAAYRQVALMPEIPDDIRQNVHHALVLLCLQGRLSSEWRTTQAHLARLANPSTFLSSLFLLRYLWPVHWVLCMSATLIVLARFQTLQTEFMLPSVLLVLAALILRQFVAVAEGKINCYIHGLIGFFAIWASCAIPLLDFSKSFRIPQLLAPQNGVMLLMLVVVPYSILWARAALCLSLKGMYTSPRYWPIAPMIHVKFSAPQLADWARGAVIPAASMTLLLMSVVYLPEAWKDVLKTCWSIIMVCAFISAALILGIPFIKKKWHQFKDRSRLNSLLVSRVEVATVLEFLTLLSSFKTSGARAAFLRHLREKEAVVQIPDLLPVLVELSSTAEQGKYSERNYSYIDELARLHEQLQMRSQTGASSQATSGHS